MATPKLPAGVIRNNAEGVSGDIEQIDTLRTEELAKLWRAYSAKQKFLDGDVGRRLENFFWRIWSNERVRSRIRGSQVAVIFMDISEGHIIRTTPTSSPRTSRIYAVTHDAQEAPHQSLNQFGSDEPRSSVSAVRRPRPTQTESEETIVPSRASEPRERERSRPPPILKKPGSEYGTSSKTARFQTPTWKTGEPDPDHDEPMSPQEFEAARRAPISPHGDCFDPLPSPLEANADLPSPTSRSNQIPTAPKMARSSSSQSSSSARGSRKKPSFVVSSARRRPVLGRRQSSQSANSSTSKTPSPRLKPTKASDGSSSLGKGSSIVSQARPNATSRVSDPPLRRLCTSRSASPVSESPFHRPTRDHEALDKTTSPEEVHKQAVTTLAPRSQWLPLNDTLKSSDMKRSASATTFKPAKALPPKSSLASTSSTNISAAGNIAIAPPTLTTSRPTLLGRASSLIMGKGKSRPAFDVGPSEPNSAAPSRRPSVEILAEQDNSASAMPVVKSRSQTQLSGLLDEQRKREAGRDRKRALDKS